MSQSRQRRITEGQQGFVCLTCRSFMDDRPEHIPVEEDCDWGCIIVPCLVAEGGPPEPEDGEEE